MILYQSHAVIFLLILVLFELLTKDYKDEKFKLNIVKNKVDSASVCAAKQLQATY